MRQLREDLKYRPIAIDEARKLFDHGDGG